jgi:DinB superfamily
MKELADELRAEVGRAAKNLQAMGEEGAGRSRGQGRWVAKEILGHLIDSAVNNHMRFVRAQIVSPLVMPDYEQEVWVSIHRYRERPWAELVDLWVALNRHLAVVMAGVPAEKLQTPCTIGDGEPGTLESLMRHYLEHLKHHLEQIGV